MSTLYENCTILNKCLCCNGDNLYQILDMHNQPLANSYIDSITENQIYYPLSINYCQTCTHLQLSHAVNPDLLFKKYLYVSGTSITLREYFNNFAKKSLTYFQDTNDFKILDIACNDGSQLTEYSKMGYKTYGIDPAENLYKLSNTVHNVVCDYFNESSINNLECNMFDIIIAQNVFAHINYPKKFLDICSQHLHVNGKIFIQTSQSEMIENGEFDTIYHEHISFFNIQSMVVLLQSSGMYLEDVFKPNIHGTSYVFVISKNSLCDNSANIIKTETIRTLEKMKNFANNANKVVDNLKKCIDKYRLQGYSIVGYGAAAKGNTILNFGGITLDYIIDDNKLKHNLYTPGRKIKIININDINDAVPTQKILWVLLSWNFIEEIKERIKIKFQTPQLLVKYFPNIELIEF